MKKRTVLTFDRITATQFESYLSDHITINGKSLTQEDMSAVVRIVFNSISDILVAGGSVAIRDFGICSLYDLKDGRHRIGITPNDDVNEAIDKGERLLELTDDILEECRTEKQAANKAKYDAKVKANAEKNAQTASGL